MPLFRRRSEAPRFVCVPVIAMKSESAELRSSGETNNRYLFVAPGTFTGTRRKTLLAVM